MTYDHTIRQSQVLDNAQFHLSCGFYETTAFFFEKANFAVVIHCRGEFTFYTPAGEKLGSVKAKPMTSGRGCYMDVQITTDGDQVIFRLPEYDWIDHYPDCDGESDRWDARIIGVRDTVCYPCKA